MYRMNGLFIALDVKRYYGFENICIGGEMKHWDLKFIPMVELMLVPYIFFKETKVVSFSLMEWIISN